MVGQDFGLDLLTIIGQMTSYMPVAIPGQLVPGIIEPQWQFSYVTERIHGKPMKQTPFTPTQVQTPKDIGDERHHQLLSAIKGLSVTQQSTQIADALPDPRSWRG